MKKSMPYKPPARMNIGRKINMGYDKMLEIIINSGLEGSTHAMIASQLNISKSFLYELQSQDDNVSDALELAKTYSQAYLEKKAMDNLESKYFQAAVWNKFVNSRYPEDYHENFTLNVRNLPKIEDNITVLDQKSGSLSSDDADSGNVEKISNKNEAQNATINSAIYDSESSS